MVGTWKGSSELLRTGDWYGVMNWLVPPPNCVFTVPGDVKERSCAVTPEWKSGPFWPFIVDEKVSYKSYVKDSYIIPQAAISSGKDGMNQVNEVRIMY